MSCRANGACIIAADTPVAGGSRPTLAIAPTIGSTWSIPMLPVGLTNLYGVSCGSAAVCVAVGGRGRPTPLDAAIYTTDGGKVWSKSTVSGDADLEGVSCPSPTTCVAVGDANAAGDQGAAVFTRDGGATWSEGTVPGDASDEYSRVSCASTNDCVAVGDGVIVTTDGGSTWEAGSPPPGMSFNDVSCPTVLRCVAVGSGVSNPWGEPGGGSVAFTVDGGMSWALGHLPRETSGLGTVSCPRLTTCVALGNGDAIVSRDGGRSWSSAALPNDSSVLSDATCVSAGRCVAVGSSGHESTPELLVTEDGGVTWRPG